MIGLVTNTSSQSSTDFRISYGLQLRAPQQRTGLKGPNAVFVSTRDPDSGAHVGVPAGSAAEKLWLARVRVANELVLTLLNEFGEQRERAIRIVQLPIQ